MKVAIGIPTLSNFKGLAELFASLWGEDYTPFVVSNWAENIGVSGAWNEILRATQSYDFVVICNDDIIWHRHSFQWLIDGWSNRPDDAILVSGVNGSGSPFGYYKSPDYSCFGINPQEYLNKVGWFDENFTPAYFEDNDSHYRIKLSGYEAYSYSAAGITHKGSQTQNADPKKPVVPPKMFENNRSYYKSKWGGSPGKESFKHPYNDVTKDWKYWRDR